MQHIFLIAVTVFGITTAQAQTASTSGVGMGSDPLRVPTSSLPTGSAGNSVSGNNSASGSNNSASSISAPSSNSSQVPLQLSGETPNTSTQAATSTAAASSHSSSSICPPPVPTSDGGSANLTDMVGGSLSGC
jgi:hypothetical protein